MRKLVVVLLSSALCFNNSFMSLHALDDDSSPIDEPTEEINEGDEIEADFDTGVITDITTGESFNAKAFPEFIKNIMANGGLVGYTRSGM